MTTSPTTNHSTHQSTRRVTRGAAPIPEVVQPSHDLENCAGCDYVVHIAQLAQWLHESVHTLYKYSAIGWPAFPKRLHLRNGRVATTCRLTKAWLTEVTS